MTCSRELPQCARSINREGVLAVAAPSQPTPAMPVIASTAQDVDLALGLLGLSRAPVVGVMTLAEALVANVIKGLHPRYFAGVVAWGETTRYLREALSLMQVGWQEELKNALPATVVRDGGASAMSSVLSLPYGPFESGGYQIVVAGGDEFTGATGNGKADPSCANLKGHLMVQAINANTGNVLLHRIGNSASPVTNQLGLELGDEIVLENDPSPAPGNMATWVLLVRYHTSGIYAELSRPESITRQGKIKSWSHRIIFGKIATSSGVPLPVNVPMGSIGPAPKFDFGMSDELNEEALPGA